MLGGLDILSNEKLERLEAMANQMERVADKMQDAARIATGAGEKMQAAARAMRDD